MLSKDFSFRLFLNCLCSVLAVKSSTLSVFQPGNLWLCRVISQGPGGDCKVVAFYFYALSWCSLEGTYLQSHRPYQKAHLYLKGLCEKSSRWKEADSSVLIPLCPIMYIPEATQMTEDMGWENMGWWRTFRPKRGIWGQSVVLFLERRNVSRHPLTEMKAP